MPLTYWYDSLLFAACRYAVFHSTSKEHYSRYDAIAEYMVAYLDNEYQPLDPAAYWLYLLSKPL